MKKILCTLVVLFAASCVCAYACSLDQGSITGGACSIKNLENLETKSAQPKKENWAKLPDDKDLRPVNIYQGTIKSNDNVCLFGPCLRSRLGK